MARVILDTDLAMGAPGSDIDDGFALALAHLEPGIDLELITTVNGNTDVESATLLSLVLAEKLGIDAPVVRGAANGLLTPQRRRVPAPTVLGLAGGQRPSPGYAAVEMVRRVRESPGEITIVAIGPLTNVALAITLDEQFAASVAEIVIMGGTFFGHNHQTGMPGEFNVHVDPEAAATVLRSGARQRWVGLDVTRRVRLTREDAKTLAETGPGTFGDFAGEYTTAWIDFQQSRNPGDPLESDSCAMHDPLAVAAVTHPELLTWRPAFVSVVTGESVARGVMVSDMLSGVNPPPANCQIAETVDAPAFLSYFLGALSAAGSTARP